jgi:hypothetical protein
MHIHHIKYWGRTRGQAHSRTTERDQAGMVSESSISIGADSPRTTCETKRLAALIALLEAISQGGDGLLLGDSSLRLNLNHKARRPHYRQAQLGTRPSFLPLNRGKS